MYFLGILDAFSGLMPVSLNADADPVSFTAVYKSGGTSFTNSYLTINCSSSCSYWMHICFDTPPLSQTKMQLLSSIPTGNWEKLILLKNYASLSNVDTMTRDSIVTTSSGETTLWLSSVYEGIGRSMNQPYWSGFRIDNIFRPLIFFSVYRSTSVFNGLGIPIYFDAVRYLTRIL